MKRNIVAAILSGIVPGVGQFYNRQWLKGIAFLAPILILSALIRSEMLLSETPFWALLGLLVILILGIWSVVDAYRTEKPTS